MHLTVYVLKLTLSPNRCIQSATKQIGVMANSEGYESVTYQNFVAKVYLTRRFMDPTDKERGVQPFYLESFHKFYTSTFPTEWDASTARLLEFGGGPAIYPLISAATHVSEVVFSDYAQSSLDEVSLWKNNDPQAHDWSPYFRYVVQTLEGNPDPEAASQREMELRSKFKELLLCDIRADDVFGSVSIPAESFDVVSTNFCLDVVSNNAEEYAKNIRHVCHYLKPGGFIVSLVPVEESWYVMNNVNDSKREFHLCITQQQIHSAHKEAGLKIRDSAHFNIPAASQYILDDGTGIHFIAAQK